LTTIALRGDGNHTITAVFNGGKYFKSSTSQPVTAKPARRTKRSWRPGPRRTLAALVVATLLVTLGIYSIYPWSLIGTTLSWRIAALAGVASVTAATPVLARKTMVANLRYAAQARAKNGVTLVIEPLNRIDTPGFLIGTTAEGLALIDEVGEPNCVLQYDCYHAQRAEGNIIATLRAQIGRIGHVQIADSPDRHEPGTGELAYERILPALDGLGYTGWVGLEYRPSLPAPQSFAWIDVLQPHEVTR